MKNLDNFKSNTSKNRVDITVSCSSCNSKETSVFKGERQDEFNVTCTECENKFAIRLPGLGNIL